MTEHDTLAAASGDTDVLSDDATEGLVIITLSAEDTEPLCGEFYHEMRAVFSDVGVSTVLTGILRIDGNLIGG